MQSDDADRQFRSTTKCVTPRKALNSLCTDTTVDHTKAGLVVSARYFPERFDNAPPLDHTIHESLGFTTY